MRHMVKNLELAETDSATLTDKLQRERELLKHIRRKHNELDEPRWNLPRGTELNGMKSAPE